MPVEVVREPVGKTVLKNSGTHQNVLVLFRSLASISERLCFRFDFVDITKAPANTLTASKSTITASKSTLMASKSPLKSVRVHVKVIRVLVETVRVPLEALRLLQRSESVCRDP